MTLAESLVRPASSPLVVAVPVREAGRSFVPTVVDSPRAPGRHREPGSTPWRTALREFAILLTFGFWVPWRPASMRIRERTVTV